MRALPVAALLVACCAHATPPSPAAPFDELFARAAAERAAVVIELRSGRSESCDAFDRAVAASDDIRRRLERTVFVRYDAATPRGREAALRIGWP
ncbi:MAG: hypothetical protein LC659_14570, partial [Myxococcales bacterium]|nr:hypothetical protein [Myxococcales bacterium]